MQIFIYFKTVSDIFNLICKHEYFGKMDAVVLIELKQKFKSLFPHANLFKTTEEQEQEVMTCLKNLSITSSSMVSDLTEKLNKSSLNENQPIKQSESKA